MRLLLLSLAACVSAATEPPAAPALLLPAAEAAAVPAEADGCVATVEALPVAADPRLRGERVVVVHKSARRVMLFEGGKIRHDRPDGAESCWPIALGITDDGAFADGPKRQRGDRKTPEGWYRTSDRPWSQFHGAITLHYPNREDADLALAEGRIDQSVHAAIVSALARGKVPPTNTALGSDLLLHGGGSAADWTWGCVALDDADIDALRGALPAGMLTDVLILP